MDNLEFTVRRLTFHNKENGYSVIKTECGKTVVGSFNGVTVGEAYTAQGDWETSKYGTQFKAKQSMRVTPQSTKGILAYLKGGAIEGIGPKTAERIVNAFGAATLSAIEDEKRLATVRGIGAKSAKKIAKSAVENRAINYIYSELQGYGITGGQAAKIFKLYDREALDIVRRNPFRLAFDIHGVGFLTCDRIADSVGFDKEHPERIKSGSLYFIDELCQGEGNVFVRGHEVVPILAKNLGVERELVSSGLRALVAQSSLLCEMVDGEARYYLPKLHKAEKGVAEAIIRMSKPSAIKEAQAKQVLDKVIAKNAIKPSEEQYAAALSVITRKLSVLTGGPGSGKTTTTNVIIQTFEELGLHVVLASPTGRAAKRMTEVSGREASTIHRLLEYNPIEGGFQRDEHFPLDGDVFVFDEASMLDISLAHSLLRAVPDDAIVLFVGDIDQLPSVGPGSVLRDLIDSGVVNVQQLTKIFRQAASSKIITSAYKINKGEMPEQLLQPEPGADAYFIEREDDQAVIDTIVTIITNNLRKQGFNSDDIQVLCPMNRNAVGSNNLNTVLQAVLNPAHEEKPEITRGQRTFRQGDRVIQTQNNYDKSVMNGDVGKITFIDLDKRQVTVDYGSTYHAGAEEYLITYEIGELDQISLAYAMSIHKCVHPDTLVETPEGLVPIKAIAEEGVIATPDGVRPYHGKFTKKKGKVLKLTTRSGYTLTVSPEHGMTVWNGEKHVRLEARDMIVGDMLRLRLGATVDVQEAPGLPGAPDSDVRAVRYELPEQLNENVAELFGLMVADGTIFKGGFRLVKRYPSVVARFGQLVHEIFGANPVPADSEGTQGLEVCSAFLVEWLKAVGGMQPNQKAIPEVILKAPLRMQAAFLKGLFEDGTVNVKDGHVDHIEWNNYDHHLAEIVQTMLLRFGIVSSLRQRKTNGKPLSSLYLYGQHARRFSEAIGFVAEEKNQRLKEGTFSEEARYKIPVSKTEASFLRKHKILGLFDSQNANMRGAISRRCLNEALSNPLAPDWLSERAEWHYENITKIEELESETMCVTVPEGHRFLQNGFDGWNSQGSEYPCVITPITSSSWVMLQRNLLYTGITRAKKFLVVIGQKKMLKRSIENNPIVHRNSALVEKLRLGPNRFTIVEEIPTEEELGEAAVQR